MCKSSIKTYNILLRATLVITINFLICVNFYAQDTTAAPTPNEANRNPFQLVENGQTFESNNNSSVSTTTQSNPVINEPIEDKEEVNLTNNEPTVANLESKVEIDRSNPFQLVENGNKAIFSNSSAKNTRFTTKNTQAKEDRKPLFEIKGLNYEGIAQLFGLLFIIGFLVFIQGSYWTDIQRIYKAFTNSNMMMQLYRDKGSLLNMPYIPLYFFYTFTGGTFLFLTVKHFGVSLPYNDGYSLLLFMLGLGAFYLFKHLVLKLIGVVFPFRKEINLYHFLIGLFNQIIGLVLIPLVMLIALAPENIKIIAIYTAFVIIGLIFINRLIRSFMIASPFLAFHKFHLIVYLCAVEIAPLFIIAKLLMG